MTNPAGTLKLNKILSPVLGLIILGAVAALVYMIAVPVAGDTFTEFYILDASGKAVDYPKQLKTGEEGSVLLGIVNHERESKSYRVEIRINGITSNELGAIALKPGEKYEQIANFTPEIAGERQKVEFLLYQQGQNAVYESVHLWVDVKD
jgi:uncharacterized membrane protein